VLQRYIYIFIKYVNKTIKQYKVYILDLQIIVRFSIINFKKETKRKTVNLNLLKEHLQNTLNILVMYKLVKRLKELLLLVIKLLP
jgi:hypothetical protein